MQYTFPNYYKEFSCIAGACPDTCCAGWQIVIDDQTLKKYQHFKGPFRNRLHNDIDWKEHVFRQYNRRCAFLNEENLCDIYTEAGPEMFCRTCRNYPRHIEEFEGLREISLSLSCPEAARILLSQKEKVHFITKEKKTKEEVYDDFDYFLFTALMDTRDMLIDIIQDRTVPMQKRLWKLLAAAHDFQLCVNKNELFKWEEMRKRHEDSGYGDRFCSKIYSRINADNIENSSAASACANTPEQLFNFFFFVTPLIQRIAKVNLVTGTQDSSTSMRAMMRYSIRAANRMPSTSPCTRRMSPNFSTVGMSVSFSVLSF